MMLESLKKGVKQFGTTQDMLTSSVQLAKQQHWVTRNAISQLTEDPNALWRAKKTSAPKTFEEQRAQN